MDIKLTIEISSMSISSYYYLPKVVDSDKWKSTEYLKLPWIEDSEEYLKRREDKTNPKIRYSNLIKNMN